MSIAEARWVTPPQGDITDENFVQSVVANVLEYLVSVQRLVYM
jgi:hypothetical protein